MSDVIVVALISAGASVLVGLLSFVAVVVTNKRSNKEIEQTVTQKMAVAQAVTDTKLEALTLEVRKHNNFAQRMPAVEQGILDIRRTEEHMQEEIDHLRQFHERG